MSRSKAHKIFNKFHGWTKHEPLVHSERATAQEEFLPAPNSIAEDCVKLAVALCEDWFLFERPLTSCNDTPLDQFMHVHGPKLKHAEAAAYEAFLTKHRFGLFKIEDVHPGQGLTLKSMPGDESFDVVDANGSKSGERGDYLIARIIPYKDHWVFPGFISRLPDGAGEHLERTLKKDSRITPTDILPLFTKTIDWEAEGIERVKARLASILQRWRRFAPRSNSTPTTRSRATISTSWSP